MPEPLSVDYAEGVCLRLQSGHKLIDAISSWWCVIHGYNHPRLNHALRTQAERFSHVMLGGLTHKGAEDLAAALVRITPEGLSHVFFADSGSVGMEVAMKMAVQFWQNRGTPRHKFASLLYGYHGDTTGVMSISDPEEGMHHLFRGYLPQQFFVKPGDLEALETLFREHGSEIAAFACEPLLQGAGGCKFYAPEILREMHRLCQQYQILFIADEVATGFGRTGTLFACEQADICPDILVLGKGLTGGYLGMSATLATDEVYEAFLGEGYEKAFMHGPTFMGNALAASVALESIRIFEEERYLEKIADINAVLKDELLGFEAPGVKEVRVLGACGVIEAHDPGTLAGIQEYAAERGVWLRPFLNVVYTMPPYIISEGELRHVACVMKGFFQKDN
jgi:adenosylmethionine-8-amino-7-oxononanoate aminotransferase